MRYLIEAETEEEKRMMKEAKDLFENLHDIGWAIKMMRNGMKVARKGWNGKGMYLCLVHACSIHNISEQICQMKSPFVIIHTTEQENRPWTCSQTDLLAEDWEVIQ